MHHHRVHPERGMDRDAIDGLQLRLAADKGVRGSGAEQRREGNGERQSIHRSKEIPGYAGIARPADRSGSRHHSVLAAVELSISIGQGSMIEAVIWDFGGVLTTSP